MLKPTDDSYNQPGTVAHFHIYIVECADGTLYTGMTTDIQRRLKEHNTGRAAARYTRGRRPIRLVYTEPASTLTEALKREAEIKALARAQKLTLIQQGAPRPSLDNNSDTLHPCIFST